MKIAIFSLLLMIGSVWMLSGCETTKGLGRDIEDVGDEIEDAVD